MHVMSACVLHCQFERAPDGSVVVNEQMESSCKDVFAAGDCCSIRFADDSADKASDPPDLAKDRHWFQVHPTLHASIDVLHKSPTLVGITVCLSDAAVDPSSHAWSLLCRCDGGARALLRIRL